MVMEGLNASGLKKHPSLIPLFICLGLGVAASIAYTFRLAVKNPDVSWNKKKNPEPWNEYRDKNYKFYNPRGDYDRKTDVPKY